MSLFSFKREAKVYVVYLGNQYKLDVSAINFGQVFTEHSYSNKSLQAENMFEQSVINKANPATFELNFPALRETDLKILFDRALDHKSFDLFVVAGPKIYKVAGCIITEATFILDKSRPLSVELNGEGQRLYKDSSLEGTRVARSSTRTYNKVSYLNVLLDGLDISDRINALTVEVQNDILWVPYTTANDATVAIENHEAMYPFEYVLQKRILSGTINSYNLDEFSWIQEKPIIIHVGQEVGQKLYGFSISVPKAVCFNRLNTGGIFTKVYEWRMTENPDYLSEIIKYVTGESDYILDSDNIPILDSSGQELVESP